MPLPTGISAAAQQLVGELSVITAATIDYLPVMMPGRVTDFSVVVGSAATATGSATFQLAYAPPGSSTYTNITNGLITIASGTAAGAHTRISLPPSVDTYVQDGGTLRVTTGGTATGGGSPAWAVVVQ